MRVGKWKVGLCIFALSMVVRVALMLLLHTSSRMEGTECLNIAVSLARGTGFANAFGPNSGPTAHFTPLYPLLLSGVFRLTGTGPSGALAQQILGYSITSVGFALLPWVAEALGISAAAGFWAGIAAAILPINFWAERGTFPTVWSAVFLNLLIVYASAVWRKRWFTLQSALLGGGLIGVIALTDPVLVTVMAALFVTGLVAARFAHPGYWAVLLILPAIMLVPWVVRNDLVLGSLVVTRSSLGLELSDSNTDGALPAFEENEHGTFLRRHPTGSAAELRKITDMGEVAYNQDRMREAEGWIANHKGQFVRLTIGRVFNFWFPAMRRPIQMAAMCAITIPALIGFFVWLRTGPTLWALPLIVFVFFPLPYYIIETASRYRFPIHPLMLLFACWFGLKLAARAR